MPGHFTYDVGLCRHQGTQSSELWLLPHLPWSSQLLTQHLWVEGRRNWETTIIFRCRTCPPASNLCWCLREHLTTFTTGLWTFPILCLSPPWTKFLSELSIGTHKWLMTQFTSWTLKPSNYLSSLTNFHQNYELDKNCTNVQAGLTTRKNLSSHPQYTHQRKRILAFLFIIHQVRRSTNTLPATTFRKKEEAWLALWASSARWKPSTPLILVPVQRGWTDLWNCRPSTWDLHFLRKPGTC